jgi:ABC-2 type transport system permease protein
MRGLLAIYRKEMSHYFVSPIAYAVGAVFLVVSGFFFNLILGDVMQGAMEAEMQSLRFGRSADFDVPGIVMRSFFSLLGTITLFVAPMLTVSTYAEERSRGTMELLMTSPLRDISIVLGKFFATLTLFALLLAPTALYQTAMYLASDPRPRWRLMLVGYLGVLLLGGVVIAIGSFVSSLTENQIIAGVVTFGVSLVLWVIDVTVRGSFTRTGEIIQHLSILRHFEDFTRGVLDTSHLVFYLSMMIFGIFLTLRSIDSLRWRRA